MSVKKEFSFNAEQVTAMLLDAVNKVKTEEDPFELNELKKIFKKTVPFSLRGYVSAYLAKQCSTRGFNHGNRGRMDRNSSMHHNRYQSNSMSVRKERTVDSMGVKPPVPRAVIAEEFAKTIFISIGRNRRVYARDLVALISQAGSVEREKIGDIKVYDNYSFITLFAEDAAKVIELLDGFEYRGRKLSVSYSRKKEDFSSNSSTMDEEKPISESTDYSNDESVDSVTEENTIE